MKPKHLPSYFFIFYHHFLRLRLKRAVQSIKIKGFALPFETFFVSVKYAILSWFEEEKKLAKWKLRKIQMWTIVHFQCYEYLYKKIFVHFSACLFPTRCVKTAMANKSFFIQKKKKFSYLFRQWVAFQRAEAWLLAIQPDLNVLWSWMRKWKRCTRCLDVNLKRQTVPLVM